MLSFAIVRAGTFDGASFQRSASYDDLMYRELKPISDEFEIEALQVNGLDRDRLMTHGTDPLKAMSEAYDWIYDFSEGGYPVLVAYPLSFDWTWLYWYFVRYSVKGSPFDYSRCFDIKTAVAVKSGLPISEAGRSHLPPRLASKRRHTHHAIDDAIEQAEIFANVFEWDGEWGGNN